MNRRSLCKCKSSSPRRKMKRTALLVFFATCVIVLNSVDAQACDCFVPPPPMLREKRPDFAFSGKVTKIDHSTLSYHSIVTFKVLNSWKYDLRGKITIVSSRGENCAFPFKVGRTYLVYARLVDKTQTGTKICSITLRLSAAGKELKRLNRSRSKRIQLPTR